MRLVLKHGNADCRSHYRHTHVPDMPKLTEDRRAGANDIRNVFGDVFFR